MDSVKKWILFLLGSCCLKLSNSIINLVSYLIWNSFLNRNRNLFWFNSFSKNYLETDFGILTPIQAWCYCGKFRGWCVRKKGSLLVRLFDICGLQFGIVREVCSHLVFVLRFDDLLSLSMLQLLDLICGSLFGLCAIRIWYLVFGIRIWCLWTFGFLVLYLWERKLFETWVCESAFTPICIIPNLL